MRFTAGLKAIDWMGTFTILGVTIMILLGLDFGGVTFPWSSPKVICLIVFGFLMVGLFFFSEAKLAKYPLMPLGLFSRRSNVAALLVCFCHGIVSTGLVKLGNCTRTDLRIDLHLSLVFHAPIFPSCWRCFGFAVRGSNSTCCGHAIIYWYTGWIFYSQDR